MNKDSIYAYNELSSLYYDAVEKYASQREINFFSLFIDQYPGRILEAMSGSGRLQIPLMQRGYIVDGVDHSDVMLQRCRERCKEFGLKPELYEQSLQDLSLPYRYSTVIIPFGSFQLLADRNLMLRALKNLRAHMLPSGALLIDIFIPDTFLDEYLVSSIRLDECRVIVFKRRHVFNLAEKKVRSFCLYELVVDGMVQKQEDELIEIIWFTDDEWKELLQQAGFEIVQIYDEKFRNTESSRVIHARVVVKG